MIEALLYGVITLPQWQEMTEVPEPEPAAVEQVIEPPWDAINQCESGGIWDTNTGNGFFGGLQWQMSTWVWLAPMVLGPDYPHPVDATPEQEIAVANHYVALERKAGRGGYNPWPACASKLGLPR